MRIEKPFSSVFAKPLIVVAILVFGCTCFTTGCQQAANRNEPAFSGSNSSSFGSGGGSGSRSPSGNSSGGFSQGSGSR